MQADEYETAIGKLVILKMFLTQPHQGAVDDVIEGLENEYIQRHTDRAL